jgi:hypothetical protein
MANGNMIPSTFQEWLTPTFGLMGGETVFCPSVLRRFNPEFPKPEKVSRSALGLSTYRHVSMQKLLASISRNPPPRPYPTPKAIFLKAIILRATGSPSGSLKDCGGLPTLDRPQ